MSMDYISQIVCNYCGTIIKNVTPSDIKQEECYVTKYAAGAHRYDGYRKYLICPICQEKIIFSVHRYIGC